MTDMPKGTHYADEDLEWVPLGVTGWERASVTLAATDTAWNPASTKSVLVGPAVITYERGPGGGVGARIEEGS